MNEHIRRPPGITTIAGVNTVGAVLTLGFWGLVYLRIFAADSPPAELDAGSLATTFGFMIGDLSWAAILLIASAIGLWRMRAWGWLAAQMVNILWLYSMTVVWSRDLHSGTVSPGALLFLPFVPFSAWACFYLWSRRSAFGIEAS